MGKGNPISANCLLLTLLPNVKRVAIGDLSEYRDINEMICNIATVNRRASPHKRYRVSLTHLSEGFVRGSRLRARDERSSGILELLLWLPSIRTIHVSPVTFPSPIPLVCRSSRLLPRSTSSTAQSAIPPSPTSETASHLRESSPMSLLLATGHMQAKSTAPTD